MVPWNQAGCIISTAGWITKRSFDTHSPQLKRCGLRVRQEWWFPDASRSSGLIDNLTETTLRLAQQQQTMPETTLRLAQQQHQEKTERGRVHWRVRSWTPFPSFSGPGTAGNGV